MKDMQFDNSTPVVVVGGCHHNTLGVIRSLGWQGLSPILITVTNQVKPYVTYSRYISKSLVVENCKEALKTLLEIGGSFSLKKAVLIACTDGMASVVDENCEALREFYHVPGVGGGKITYLQNKGVMSELAQETGFMIPLSITTDTTAEIIRIPYPWIIKPLWSKDGKKADIKRIYSKEQWAKYKKEDHYRDVQVQQLIEKDYEYQLIGLSLKGGNEVIIPGYSNVIRPAETTNTGFLRYSALEEKLSDIVDISRKFLRATGYSGLFSLEFLKGKDGNDYFMEINFRNDGNAICVTSAGVNLPYAWYLYNTGQDYSKYLKSTRVKAVYVMPEVEDLGQVWHRKVSAWRWLRDLVRTDTFMEFSIKDPKPFIHLLMRRLKLS